MCRAARAEHRPETIPEREHDGSDQRPAWDLTVPDEPRGKRASCFDWLVFTVADSVRDPSGESGRKIVIGRA